MRRRWANRSTIMATSELLSVFNQVRENKRQAPIVELPGTLRLREDLGFESLDMAELTVRIEEEFGRVEWENWK